MLIPDLLCSVPLFALIFLVNGGLDVAWNY